MVTIDIDYVPEPKGHICFVPATNRSKHRRTNDLNVEIDMDVYADRREDKEFYASLRTVLTGLYGQNRGMSRSVNHKTKKDVIVFYRSGPRSYHNE